MAGEHDRMMRSWRKAWVRGRADGGQGPAGRPLPWGLAHGAVLLPGARGSELRADARGASAWRGQGGASRRDSSRGVRVQAGPLGWLDPGRAGGLLSPQGARSRHVGAGENRRPSLRSRCGRHQRSHQARDLLEDEPHGSTTGLHTSRLRGPPQASPCCQHRLSVSH